MSFRRISLNTNHVGKYFKQMSQYLMTRTCAIYMFVFYIYAYIHVCALNHFKDI
jgi:hypothetical protein